MKPYALVPAHGAEGTFSLSKDLAHDKAERAGGRVIPLEFDLRVVVDKYFELRGYAEPNAAQALLFLFSEIGELSDRFLHGQAQWVRNDPENKNGGTQQEVDNLPEGYDCLLCDHDNLNAARNWGKTGSYRWGC
jgi:hypothetical protein